MADIKEYIGKKVLLIDGAMGTLLMEEGIRPDENFDLQNILKPETVKLIHKKYVGAGADIIETNTFGANRLKLSEYGIADKVFEINSAAVKLAKEAAGGQAFVCGSIGPLGKLIYPVGDVSFQDASDIFAEQAKALESAGADCLCVETISDLQEMRAAVIGIKSFTKLPIIASMTYDKNGATIFGTNPESASTVLDTLSVDVISANCSTGPQDLLKIAKSLTSSSNMPVMIMPNAGMPKIINGKTIYDMTPDKFADYAKKLISLGVSIVGGCCGTRPEHIAAIREIIKNGQKVKVRPKTNKSLKFSSRTRTVIVKKNKFFSIGERINPTGKKLLKDDIASQSFILLKEEALLQKRAGLLDVNVSVADTNEPQNMAAAVNIIQKATDSALCIDSPNIIAVEAGLREFCGRALLNSVNGKKESLEKVLPIAKKYGAAIIGLLLDDSGIPKTAIEKTKIAERIIKAAKNIGINQDSIFIDALVMTAGVGINGSLETLKAVKTIKKKFGVKTILGISNISHGLPNRSKINSLFLKLALHHGLDAGIVDVADKNIIKALASFKKPSAKKAKSILSALLKAIQSSKAAKSDTIDKKPGRKQQSFSKLSDIEKAVIEGDINKTKLFVSQALSLGFAPQNIMDKALIPGMEIVGKKFSKKIYFLPQVISSAEAMAAGFALCKEKIPKDEEKIMGKVLIATVRGDIHDIGKNIVKMMLENHGFQVIDLGKDVPSEKIIEIALKEKPNAIALSALLTTTMLEMKDISEKLKSAGLKIPLIVGGAVVTDDFAKKINASYGIDATEAVSLARKILSKL